MSKMLFRASIACASLWLSALLATAPALAEGRGGDQAESEEAQTDEAEAEGEDEQVRTPFGPAAKANRKPAPSDKPVDAMVTVTESGDTVTFTRRTPFGSQTWRRKLAELSDHEKMLLERSRAAAKKTAEKAAEPPAEKPAP